MKGSSSNVLSYFFSKLREWAQARQAWTQTQKASKNKNSYQTTNIDLNKKTKRSKKVNNEPQTLKNKSGILKNSLSRFWMGNCAKKLFYWSGLLASIKNLEFWFTLLWQCQFSLKKIFVDIYRQSQVKTPDIKTSK